MIIFLTSISGQCSAQYLGAVFSLYFSLLFNVKAEIFQEYNTSRSWSGTGLLDVGSHTVGQEFHFSEITPKP